MSQSWYHTTTITELAVPQEDIPSRRAVSCTAPHHFEVKYAVSSPLHTVLPVVGIYALM